MSAVTLIPSSPVHRPRSLSRASSRGSMRSGHVTPPPIVLDDRSEQVAVRGQISTLRHSIRHQQAQLTNLENMILRGPRPLPPGMISPPRSPEPELSRSYSHSHSPSSSISKLKKRSSFDVLHNLAGPDSSLPLPRRENGIKEGVPSPNPTHRKRPSSPTRTLSRIPISSVGNARALAEEGQSGSTSPNGSLPPPSPNESSSKANRRVSVMPGGTTKVLVDLQAGVMNARNALENTRAQLRLSQRSVAQLTRQTEDLKEARERLRLENEGLNNVVARKERLLQEVLERARKAEAEAASLKNELKSEQTTSKKTLTEMETALSASTTLSQRSEGEYIALRSSVNGLVEGWKRDMTNLREEMQKREEKVKKDAEEAARKYKLLLEEVVEERKTRGTIQDLLVEDKKMAKEVEAALKEEIVLLREQIDKSGSEFDQAVATAAETAGELARLRRLIQAAGKSGED